MFRIADRMSRVYMLVLRGKDCIHSGQGRQGRDCLNIGRKFNQD